MVIDLQSHTSASDGTLSPTELLLYAADCGVEVLGVTDHDTTAGIEEARGAAAGAGVEIVPGIELSCRAGRRSVHILGLFVDPAHPAILEYERVLREERIQRARRMVERLNGLGFEITFEEVAAKAAGGMIGRPHVARTLVDRGHVPNVSAAFSSGLISDGGRADVPRRVIEPVEAVIQIRSWGGAAVIAHPGARHHDAPDDPLDEDLIETMKEAGLAGLEVDHPDHDRRARRELRRIAGRLDLVQTGGSDCHGHHSARPGTCRTDPVELDRLRERASTARGVR